ncbi:MAG: hypothetical protein IK081_12515 [Lachnospiraceae bacterium]|nr:hypothetical protein [Lachnospiraceae bacterium]
MMKVKVMKILKVRHRGFLGAHRYTTRGGTARPAGSFGSCAGATTEGEVKTWQSST